MLPTMFQTFDGTGRDPRALQVTALEWVAANRTRKFLALQLPTGVGKSAIARAIQRASKGHIIVPSNALLDQYQKTYTDVNFVKGKEHYVCEKQQMYCTDAEDVGMSCDTCPMRNCKEKARKGEPSVFNPISKFYAEVPPARTTIIDEGHKIMDVLELLVSEEFSYDRYKYPDNLTLQTLVPWLKSVAAQYADLAVKESGTKKALKYRLRGLAITRLAGRVWESPDDFAYYESKKTVKGVEKRSLFVRPITLPRGLLKMCIGDVEQVILLSATLPKHKAQEIFGSSDFAYLDMQSPIPVKNRPIKIDYQGFTSKTPALDIARWVRTQVDLYGGPTIVHVTYNLARELQYYLPEAIYHTGSHDKDDAMKRFKAGGGIWVAPGCAEGIDLPDGECRLNLIPILPFANIGDPVVEARRKRYGMKPYERHTLLTFMQQVGRSTRGETDYSTTVVGDSRVVRLLRTYKSEISNSFLQAVEW